ncbi:MAG: flagellar protein FlaG [Desulfobacterium sp.]|jgi:flagellar protein FlaG|nr:flagellar protein FlaG [Desulfobacterium sp.]
MNTNYTPAAELKPLSPVSNFYQGSAGQNQGKKIHEPGQLNSTAKDGNTTKSDKTINGAATREEANEIIESLYELTEMLQTSLSFQVDQESDSVIIKVIDKKNNGVIRQIPSEDILKLREKMSEMTGLLFNESV